VVCRAVDGHVASVLRSWGVLFLGDEALEETIPGPRVSFLSLISG
jgi:hypothetical protein